MLSQIVEHPAPGRHYFADTVAGIAAIVKVCAVRPSILDTDKAHTLCAPCDYAAAVKDAKDESSKTIEYTRKGQQANPIDHVGGARGDDQAEAGERACVVRCLAQRG
jgi:hypothetical protein